MELLREAAGLDIVELDAGCCGIAGSYGFKKEKYELSLSIGEKLFQAIARYPGATVVTECGTCQVQIEQVVGVKTVHPVSLLWGVMGIAGIGGKGY